LTIDVIRHRLKAVDARRPAKGGCRIAQLVRKLRSA
jgi:hypothetical protein